MSGTFRVGLKLPNRSLLNICKPKQENNDCLKPLRNLLSPPNPSNLLRNSIVLYAREANCGIHACWTNQVSHFATSVLVTT